VGKLTIFCSDEVYAFWDRFALPHGTESYGSCSTMLDGQMYIFGGQDERTQISIVEDCGLRRVGTLPINFYYGQCNSYFAANAEQYALLCFEWPGTIPD